MIRKSATESTFKSKVVGLFNTENNVKSKETLYDVGTPNDYDNDEWDTNISKDDRLYPIDEKTQEECVKMLKYYKPSSPSKASQRLEKYLPVYIELDTPIPEELAMDYEYAKYDISGLLPESEEMEPKYRELFIKYETLSCF